jgi:hypothetical protein
MYAARARPHCNPVAATPPIECEGQPPPALGEGDPSPPGLGEGDPSPPALPRRRGSAAVDHGRVGHLVKVLEATSGAEGRRACASPS